MKLHSSTSNSEQIGRFLRSGGLFLLFGLGVYLVVMAFLIDALPVWMRGNIGYARGSGGYLSTRILEAERSGPVDVVVVGSSHAYRGFDPRIFRRYGIRLFNLGSSSQTPLQSELLIRRYIGRMRPSIVIIEVFPKVLSADGVESALDFVSNLEIRPDILRMAFQVNHLKVYHTLVYSWLRQLRRADDDWVEPWVRQKDRYIPGGYVARFGGAPAGDPAIEESTLELSSRQIEALQRLLATVRSHGARPIFVQAPVTRGYYESIRNNAEVNRALAAFGVPYLNMNDPAPDLPDRYFYDGHHLNQQGVEIFNEELIALLNGRGLLPGPGPPPLAGSAAGVPAGSRPP